MEDLIASLPIQQVISLQVSSLFKASEIRIPTPPVQKVTLLRVVTPSPIVTSPVHSRPKPVSEFSYFWETENTSEVASNSAVEVAELPESVLVLIIAHKIPSVPVQRISLVHADAPSFVSETQVPMAPVQSISTLRAFSSSLIIMILITSPTLTDLVYCSFTLEKVLTSLQSSVHKTKVSSL